MPVRWWACHLPSLSDVRWLCAAAVAAQHVGTGPPLLVQKQQRQREGKMPVRWCAGCVTVTRH